MSIYLSAQNLRARSFAHVAALSRERQDHAHDTPSASAGDFVGSTPRLIRGFAHFSAVPGTFVPHSSSEISHWEGYCYAMTYTRLAVVALLVVGFAPVAAQDWPQWRGPGRDGLISAFRDPAAWPVTLTKRWNVDVGTGYATPLVVGDRLYVFTRQGENEVMTAFDAASAKVLWRTSYPAPFKMNPATAPHGPGPKSTPTFAANRLFTLGISGIVTAFDATTGRQIWQKPAGPIEPLYHTAMSPLVVGNLMILHVGGHDNGALTAFDAATGDVRWRWNGDGPAYGSPLLFDLSGTPQVVTFTQKYFVGVSLEGGKLLWRRPSRRRARPRVRLRSCTRTW